MVFKEGVVFKGGVVDYLKDVVVFKEGRVWYLRGCGI